MAFGFNDTPVKVKLERAVELLETTNKPLSQISQELGFGGDGETLALKLEQEELYTTKEIRERAKSIRGGKHVIE